jgi:translation elongation factor EF-1alpha
MLSKLKKLFKSKKRRNVVKKKTIKKLKKKVLKKKKAMRIAKKPAAQEELVGIVTHYFPHVKAGVIKIKKGTIALGDTIHIKGHTTDFRQKVTSLQIDREPITSAPKGKEIGLAVKSRVRHNDKVFKIK